MEENASKALIMAASVLLGIMLITIGVYLFYLYGQYSSSTYKKIEDTHIAQFNNQFLKYYGTRLNENNQIEEVKCTIHDITSLANLAKQNNLEMEIENMPSYNETTSYIQIDIGTSSRTKNLEKWNDEQLLDYLKQNATHMVYVKDELGQYVLDETTGERITEKQAKNYVCTEVIISDITKKICYMRFEHKKDSRICTCR